MFVVFKPGLDLVVAVSRRFKSVNSHDLIFGQTSRQRHLGVGAFEFAVVLRQPRNEFEFLLCRGKKIGDHRHIDRPRRRLRLQRILRFRRSGIDRRLIEHVILDRKLLVARALAIAQLPLLGDRTPIRARLGGVNLVRSVIFLQSAAVLGHRRRKIWRGRRLIGMICGGLRSKHCRRKDQTGGEQIAQAAQCRTDRHSAVPRRPCRIGRVSTSSPRPHIRFCDATRAAMLPPSRWQSVLSRPFVLDGTGGCWSTCGTKLPGGSHVLLTPSVAACRACGCFDLRRACAGRRPSSTNGKASKAPPRARSQQPSPSIPRQPHC